MWMYFGSVLFRFCLVCEFFMGYTNQGPESDTRSPKEQNQGLYRKSPHTPKIPKILGFSPFSAFSHKYTFASFSQIRLNKTIDNKKQETYLHQTHLHHTIYLVRGIQ
jgi:hypothetical protein